MRNSKPLSISLIIPAFNEEKYIGPCLEAVTKNSKGEFSEIIVVDNASTDRTREIAESYPGVRVVYEAQKGPTFARQKGYKESKGDILAYADADTLPLKEWAQKIRVRFDKNPNLACLSGPYYHYDIPLYARIIIGLWNCSAKILQYVVGYVVIGGNFAIRRSVLDKMDGFDCSIPFYGDDVDIGRRAHDFGKVIFSLSFIMPSSGRRLLNEGYLKTANLYLRNYLAVARRKRTSTIKYSEVR